MKHCLVITAATFLFLHTQGAFIGVSDDYHHEYQRLRPSQSTLSKSQLYSWYRDHLSPTTEKYFPYQYDKILQLKRVPSFDDHLLAPMHYTNIPLVYYPPSQHEFQRDVDRKMSKFDSNQRKYVNEKSMDYQSSKLNLGRYEKESIISRKPWYRYNPYYYWYEVPYLDRKISQFLINMKTSSQLRSKFQANRSRNYAEYHYRGNDGNLGGGTYLDHFSSIHPREYAQHGDQILEEIHDNHDHSSEILKENENVTYEEVYINDGQKLDNKETLVNKDQNKTMSQSLLRKNKNNSDNLSHNTAMPKDSQGEVPKKLNPEKKEKPKGKNSNKGNDKRANKGSTVAIKVNQKRSIPTDSNDNDDEIQPRMFGAIGNMAKGIKKYFFGSSDPETVIMYQGPNGNVQLTEHEFATLMQQQQNGLQLSPEQFYMKNRVGGGLPAQLTQEQLMMLMQQQQFGTNIQMQLTPEQIAALMQQQQQTQQQPGQLTPDQLALLMQQQQQQQTGQLSPDQTAALMQQSQSPQQLTPDQIAELMQQQQSGQFQSYPHPSQKQV